MTSSLKTQDPLLEHHPRQRPRGVSGVGVDRGPRGPVIGYGMFVLSFQVGSLVAVATLTTARHGTEW